VRRAVVIGWIVVSLAAIVAGYRGTSPVLAWQMFPEASRWQASIVRVTADGHRIDVREPWPGGYRWAELVDEPRLRDPFSEHDASYGIAATLDLFRQALDWVAAHTPRDDETVWLEATVTYRHNADPPLTVVLTSTPRSAG
jgi:hypothetical protein